MLTGGVKFVVDAFRLTAALLRCWPIFAVPLLFALLAVGTDQGRDAMTAAASVGAALNQGFFAYVAQTIMTLLATATALVLLATAKDADRFAAYHVPGLVGLIVGFLPSVLLQEFGDPSPEAKADAALFFAISTLTPMVWVVMARDILPRRGAFEDTDLVPLALLAAAGAVAFMVTDRALWVFMVNVLALGLVDSQTWRHARPEQRTARFWIAILAAAVAVAFGIALAAEPAFRGLRLGTYTTLLVALSFWLGLGCLALVLLRPIGSNIIATLVVVLLAYRFATGPFDLREVRFLPAPSSNPSPVTLEAHARAWLLARHDVIAASHRYPVFIVSADGGGVRSAWWTASILGALQDRVPGFVEQTYAISGVSGGSLGAAVFAARAATSPAPGSRCADIGWQACAELALGLDLLAPTLVAMLVADVGRSILRTELLPDRAAALEQAFEQSWQAVTLRDSFTAGFDSLWAGPNSVRVPVLLLNSTDARTGRRLVLAPAALVADDERADTLALLGGRSLRLSPAVLLSARFPVVSPAGWLPATHRGGAGTAIVDGGFADNSGSDSAAEALAALQAAAASLNLPNVMPIALMIANDPVSASPAAGSGIGPAARGKFAASTLGSLVAPVLTLDQLRQAGSRRAKHVYAAMVHHSGGVVLDAFDLHSGAITFPLGWMLAEPTRRAMAEQIASMLADEHSHLRQAAALVIER